MKPFRLKQFTIRQDRCAMKVGTDGLLLGAWTGLGHRPNTILDIGAGTGLIALQMAQRSGANTIDAVEVEDNAYEQCVENFEASPWADRLFCYHASFQKFWKEMDETYDLIVSNPPFYAQKPTLGASSRTIARQNHFLPFNELVSGVYKLLSPQGVFSVIIPHDREALFIAEAAAVKLYPKRITSVKGNPRAETKRSLLEFTQSEVSPKIDDLVIEMEVNSYSKAYKELTREFYLNI